MEAPGTNIAISLNVDECSFLPEKASVDELLGYDGSCRTLLLPAISGAATALTTGNIESAGGPLRPNWWNSVEDVSMKAVNLFKVRDAYYFPQYGVVIDRNGRAMGTTMSQASYVTPDLLKIPHVCTVNNSSFLSAPPDLDVISNAVVTMPWGALHNYGHFVIDCLSSVATLCGLKPLSDYRFAFPILKPWHREHLSLLEVTPFEFHQSCIYVKNVLFTDCMASFLHAPNRNLSLVPQLQFERLACGRSARRRIYLSRRSNTKRHFLSEARLETLLNAQGFEIIRPETMTVREQLLLFAESSVVVGCTGAAFANVLYCQPGAIVVEVQPRTMENVWVRNLCLHSGLRWAPYFCDSVPPEQSTVYGGKVRADIGISFDFDLDSLARYVAKLMRSSNCSTTPEVLEASNARTTMTCDDALRAGQSESGPCS